MQPRTVAAARAQSAKETRDREAIAEARRQRRERERDSASRRTTQPPRYKRKGEDVDFERFEKRNFGVPERQQPHPEEVEIDPLDAQNLGLHDEAAELGHEEIRLNLGDEPEHVAPHGEEPTTATPESKPIS